jgi:two-component system, cell cycle sensor histidine kinase and response regulator CckA
MSKALPTNRAARFQQRLLQLRKMEAVGELAGGIAHDFNNLLLVLRSYAELLLEEVDLSSTARHHSGEILAASRRAAELTRELLALSRRQPLQLKPTNLNGVMDSSAPMLSRLAGKGVTGWVQLLPHLWPIQADAAQLEQVLVNLAAHARDATPHGGKFLLETTNVVIEDKHAAMPLGEYVFLAVSETGLGLASVYGIVKQSGGYIWAYSESGYGATCKIYMPGAAAVRLSPEDPFPKLAARRATNSTS